MTFKNLLLWKVLIDRPKVHRPGKHQSRAGSDLGRPVGCYRAPSDSRAQ